MFDKLRLVAAHLSEFNSKTADEAKWIRATYGNASGAVSFEGALEKNVTNPVSGIKITGTVCAVDSGLLSSELHGIDIVVCRPACACFSYSDSHVVSASYHPSRVPEPVIDVRIGLDHSEAQVFRQLFRLEQEISCAISVAENKNLRPNVLFLDGSILPLPSDRPDSESELYARYSELIRKYVRLYSICEKENITLIGLSKDSRGRRFVDSLKPQLSTRASDTVFLNHLLSARERTFSMSYSQNPKKHPILRDIGIPEFADKINLFYIKCVEGDYPLRVEYLSGGANTGANTAAADSVASVVLSLSSINQNYAYPAVLIDADLRAALNPIELERVQKALIVLSPNSIRQMRRNARPFR